MTLYLLKITNSVIEKARCGDPNKCALAIAGNEQTPLQKWRVTGDYIAAFDPETYCWHLWRMTIAAIRAIKQFDAGNRAVKFPDIPLDTEQSIMLPPYYNQGRYQVDLHTMDAGRLEEVAALQMAEYEDGKRDYLSERKRERNERLRADGHIPQPLTEAQKARNINNRRFGQNAPWAVETTPVPR